MRARRLLAGLAAAVALTLAAPAGLGTPGPAAAVDGTPGHGRHPGAVLRHTTLGPVLGVDDHRTTGTWSWLGIPYAEPPVGTLRWKPPVPHHRWHGVRPARTHGEGCIQPGRFFSPSPDGPHYDLEVRDGLRQPVGQEVCLTLNVSRPATARRDLPVVVFVHGGSNVVGYSADPMYDGRTLARETDAVVVTVNYRLGLFGWLAPHRTTGDPVADSGNYGTLDQVAALRFVRDNARAFGGDPDNVTVMGESAGAVNVWALLVSPQARGLVDKAVPMSGGLSTTAPDAARDYADRLARAAAQDAGLDGPDAGARLLRRMPADDLVRLALRHGLDATPAVIADGAVVPRDPYAALAAGAARHVPVLAGNTLEEGKLFGGLIGAHRPSDYDRFTMQYEFDPDRPSPWTVRDLLVDEYLPVDEPGGWDEASAELTDLVFTGIARDSMNAVQGSGNDRVYYYQFAWDNEPPPFDDVYGAVHAIDLPFVFGTFGRTVFSYAFSRQNEPGRLELSGLMQGSLRQFVRTGSPQTRDLGVRWGQWPQSVVLDADDRHAQVSVGRFGSGDF
ncbi:carboxylesterase/lipase family protein [Promicromonospora citrea]|uniref:Carboxylic ester hydrolase n=2 Tax=Promicromonospora citrea TaxID=43677 RepID=A0A8H9L5T7_9MICO|nr:carboxylesterase family protein [Promicromonospora citrea]GGM34022.1 para-nitrobenzyl esterase [Promicromonospora citrea]